MSMDAIKKKAPAWLDWRQEGATSKERDYFRGKLFDWRFYSPLRA